MPDAVMPERWLPVVGWADLYEVSDRGAVRSVDRAVVRSDGRGVWHYRGRVLKPRAQKSGHVSVQLCRNNRAINRTVHSLVMEAFVGPRPAGLEVCHGPNGITDNSLDNLSYDTRSKNMYDKTRDGNSAQRNRTRCPRRHPLVEPNLARAMARKGFRTCLACQRARARLQDYRVRHGIELDLQDESDQYFAVILQSAPADSKLRTAT